MSNPLAADNVTTLAPNSRDESLAAPRAAVAAHGCKLNQAEADAISRQLTAAGFQIVPVSSEADLYVLNTCSVTHVADAKGRQWLNGAKRRNPNAKVIATGCYATRVPEEVRALGSVDALRPEPRQVPPGNRSPRTDDGLAKGSTLDLR